MPGYKQFVKEKWQSFQVDRWGGYVLREKLKLIKYALKEWHTVHVKNIPGKIDAVKIRLSELDGKGEDGELLVDEIDELRGIMHDIHSLSRVSTSISWQQSHMLWLKDGDANSKYFNSIISSRRRRNVIVSLMVNGELVEGVQPIRSVVFDHFKEHFAVQHIIRLEVGNLRFQKWK